MAVGELASFNAGGRANAFDGGYAPQCREAIRSQRTEGLPSAFELVQFSDEIQDLRGDLESVPGSSHPVITQLHPISGTHKHTQLRPFLCA